MKFRTLGGVLSLAAVSLAGAGLSACGGSGSDGGGSSSPAQAAAASTGPGATDTKNCAVPYGDAPAAVSTITSGSGAGAVADLLNVLNQCATVGGETLKWTDAKNEARTACLFVPPNASKTTQLPLLVFLQGSLFPAPPQLILSDWIPLSKTADLTGDTKRPGFILLLPIGRNTHHFYPFPDNYALGWDNWYRNLDRSSPDLNLDVAAIDQFVSQVQGRGIVDNDRVYATGWSNGAALAELYALNTPSIAAAAVYSAPAPFSDVQDPCYQTPFATTMTPIMDIHNACDIIGTCQTSTQFHKDLAQLFPKLQQNVVIVDSNKQVVQSCNAACASQTIAGDPAGNLNHLIWPQVQNNAMFTWLREHPLSAKQQ
ncbi:PHB depolymerase family esterase [Nevskia soli]|uniref:PHB depolymerase family esterase n=1 Tax=Nevskia soli TaxID=418856 RepID=UPI0014707A60|nr:PHB depolymerase family esterase [Nevskia soli]